MNEILIGRFNERVTDDDTVYILGGVGNYGSWQKVLNCLEWLNGRKILLPNRNDRERVLKYNGVADQFERVLEGRHAVITDGELDVVLMPNRPRDKHSALLTTRDGARVCLFGNDFKGGSGNPYPHCYGVGVDKWGYAPVTLDEVLDWSGGENGNG